MGLDTASLPRSLLWAHFHAWWSLPGSSCPGNPLGERLASDHASTHTGKERLAAGLGVPVQEAAQFLESFLQKYKKIKDFTQATIARCHQTGQPAAAKAVGRSPSLSHAFPAVARWSRRPCLSGGWVNRWEGGGLLGAGWVGTG